MKTKRACISIGLLVALFILVVGLAGTYVVIIQRPSLGAQGADMLRAVVGDRPVAEMEMLFFRAQDSVQQTQYKLGLSEPEAPWEVSVVVATPSKLTLTQIPENTPVPTHSPVVNTSTSEVNGTSTVDPGSPTTPPTPVPPTLTPTTAIWAPAQVAALGSLEGEGVWTPYIRDSTGRIVAYRTFFQPDPERPYSVVAVVAFDLEYTRLHFVLGFEEPYNPEAPPRSGKLAQEHKVPGLLLAIFNGGFKAQHGGAGAMSQGLVVLPPRDGLGTVAIYHDGSVRLAEWGAEILETDDMVAWRQNGPLVVKDGEINQQIYNNDPKDWGYTVDDVSPTLRSGMGISEDSKTLYYFAGPKLTMDGLAKSMIAAGVSESIQLDINSYWVHFVVYPSDLDELVPEPLLPELMTENLDRYLYPFGRDFFYITAVEK